MSCAIELELGPGAQPGEFLTRVVDAPSGGEPTAVFRLDVETLLRERDALENTVLASAASARRVVPAHEQELRGVGQRLFEAVFSERVLGTYRASLGYAQQRGEPLRLVLRLTAPQLAALPWEALYDPDTEAYMCRREPLVRHVPAPYAREPLEISPPLRMLGLVASPRGLPRLDVEAEQQRLADALAGPIAEGLIELEWLTQASWNGVHERLMAHEWHVLHFIGHGDYDVTTDQGQIALVGDDGRADLVEAEQLADLLNEARPTPRLVVLNSCSSGEQGTRDLFSGTAAALVRSGINAVAAMQFTISDSAAIAFARGFYAAIAHGRSVDDASRSGRISMLGRARSLEWVTPVLYVRGETTQLFSLKNARPDLPPREPPAPRVEIPTAGLQAMYVQARAELRAERFTAAIELLDDLIGLHPDYRDAAQLRTEAARRQTVAETYQRAVTAQTEGDWDTAVEILDRVLELQPDHAAAADLRRRCEKSRRIGDLANEMAIHAESQNWQAVLDVNDELTAVDAGAADPDGLATRARAALQERRPAAAPFHHRKRWPIILGATAVVAGVTVALLAARDEPRQPDTIATPAPVTTTTTASPVPTPASGANETIADYIKRNDVREISVAPGAAGAPNVVIPIPAGWRPVPGVEGDQFFEIVLDTPADPADPARITATFQKLTGAVETDSLLAVASGQVRNLPGYEGETGIRSELSGQPASRLGGRFIKNGLPRIVAQNTVVIPDRDGLFLLQIKAEGPEPDAAALQSAAKEIVGKTTIGT